jgi:hypothetical protein
LLLHAFSLAIPWAGRAGRGPAAIIQAVAAPPEDFAAAAATLGLAIPAADAAGFEKV